VTRRTRPATPIDPLPIILASLEELGGGAVLVLDASLRIVGATTAADELLGDPRRGALAAKVLCGTSVERPVAEALAAGRAVHAINPGGEGRLRVRGIPLAREGERVGWALSFEREPSVDRAPVLFHGMWTVDPAMKQLFRIIERVAKSDASVLVRGDTGSGKELVAQALHVLSRRSQGPFRAINCAAVPQALLESELFGHAKGAFTGAVRDTPGHFRLASGGTLFLDEVAEMPLDLQAKMLRVLETREITPVGGSGPIAVDVRIVAATHRPLRAEVEAGRFRADLMYRLRVIPVFLPPLHARQGDVMLLAEKVVDELNMRGERRIARISPGAKVALERHDWPGNVRELRNVLEYAYVIGDGAVLVEGDLPREIALPGAAGLDAVTPENRASSLPDLDRRAPDAVRIQRALERASGSRARAAKSLGVSRVTLWRRMKELGMGRSARSRK
jgi:transcriptional regulator with PAS, ATPase and Fis domain